MGVLALLYGSVCYLAFLASFAYLVGFIGDVGVPRTVSVGPAAPAGLALAVDGALLALFACQHSVMARPAFKGAWGRLVPPAWARSTYVLCSSAALGLLFLLWRPLPTVVWQLQAPVLRLAAWAVFLAGVALALASTFMISHLDLFGLRQVWCAFRHRPYQEQPFRLNALYARVRHPLMLGFLLFFWATPRMTVGHLCFALAMSGYILLGTLLEERDLARTLGPSYQAYRQAVPRFFPWPGHQPRDPPP